MLLALHASLAWGIADWWPRAFLLAHFGLFLLWQPVWRGESNIESRYAFLVVIVGFLLAAWNNWWLMAVWLAVLFGLIGGSVPGITEPAAAPGLDARRALPAVDAADLGGAASLRRAGLRGRAGVAGAVRPAGAADRHRADPGRNQPQRRRRSRWTCSTA